MTGAAVLWSAYVVAAAVGLVHGHSTRRILAMILLALAGVCVALAFGEGTAERSLDVVHQHNAFVGNQVETKDFLIEVTQAPGWIWAAASAVFCAGMGLLALTRLPHSGPYAWPLLLAWAGTVLALGLEKLAAPPEVLAFRLHAAAWLGAVVAAVALARTGPTLGAYVLTLLVIVTAGWAPAGIFGTLATRHEWGTSLDVHAIEFCAHPLARSPLVLEPGSTKQVWFLVWAPLLVVFPLLSWLSAGGAGFLVLMTEREKTRRSTNSP